MTQDPKTHRVGSQPLPSSGLAQEVLGSLVPGPPRGSLDPVYQLADSLAPIPTADHSNDPVWETWVTLALAGETYALPVTHVREILRVSTITRVPHAPPGVRGVTNLRGRVLPVVDLRCRLGLPAVEPTDTSRILVADSQGRVLGLLADGVRHVARLDRRQVQPVPADVLTTQSDYIVGAINMDDHMVILLHVDRVVATRNLSGVTPVSPPVEPNHELVP
jgi:purine-binding chemotaxis protein CheW